MTLWFLSASLEQHSYLFGQKAVLNIKFQSTANYIMLMSDYNMRCQPLVSFEYLDSKSQILSNLE